jgi:hypothetical protein
VITDSLTVDVVAPVQIADEPWPSPDASPPVLPQHLHLLT